MFGTWLDIYAAVMLSDKFGCYKVCMLILFRCASGDSRASASRLHIFTSSHLHVGVEVAVHLPGNGGVALGNYIFPFALN